MAVTVTHTTQATAPNDPAKEVSSDAWNAGHTVTGLGDAAEKNVGTAAGTVAAGDHLHTGVYEPAGVAAADITDSTATGRSVLTGDAAAGRTALSAAEASHTHDGLAPSGGTTGQVLKKASNTDYDYAWDTDATSEGGGVTLDEVIDALYPVGALYVSTVSTNPGTLLGRGTWTAFGAGRVLVGHDSGDTDFDTGEETGGAKTKAISAHAGAAVADHAAHTHSVTSNVAVGDHASHTHTYTQVVNHVHPLATGTGTTGNFSQVIGTVDTSSGGTGGTPTQTALGTLSGNPSGGVASGTTAGPSATLTHSVTNNAVTSGNPSATLTHSVTQPSAHTDLNVVQPYIVVFMWKRTA